MYTQNRNTDDYNVMLIGGQGQWGDNGAIGTEAQPASRWASIERVAATDDLFMVRANLRNAYKAAGIQEYRRDYLGFDDFFFVRDKIVASASTSFASHTHSYRVARRPDLGFGVFDPNDIDSDPAGNPWTGGGDAFSSLPHATSLYAGAMQVRDLSAPDWSASVSPSVVHLPAQSGYPLGNRARGRDLLRTLNGSSATSLMAHYFPKGSETVDKMAIAGGEGFYIREGGADRALGAWSNGGSASNADIQLDGALGGMHFVSQRLWAMDATQLGIAGVDFITAAQPVSVVARLEETKLASATIFNPQATTVRIRTSATPSSVMLNDLPLSSGSWRVSGGYFSVDLIAFPDGVELELAYSAVSREMILQYLLGHSNNPAGLDLNGDGVVDMADAIRSTMN